jgi:2-haloalkanoic acid dehalogenase type II
MAPGWRQAAAFAGASPTGGHRRREVPCTMFKLLSFDVFGTLVDTPPPTLAAFRAILAEAGAPTVEPGPFYEFWERRNIAHYCEPYRSYKDICRLSLEEAFAHFDVRGGSGRSIERYFAAFAEMALYPDVLPTLGALAATHRLAVVSNIDDDLLEATSLPFAFDLVCTAQRARGYKPDGTLFRYLLAESGLPVPAILHSGQSQFTDLVGGKPLGFTVAWINRRNLRLDPAVPKPDFEFPDLRPLPSLVAGRG